MIYIVARVLLQAFRVHERGTMPPPPRPAESTRSSRHDDRPPIRRRRVRYRGRSPSVHRSSNHGSRYEHELDKLKKDTNNLDNEVSALKQELEESEAVAAELTVEICTLKNTNTADMAKLNEFRKHCMDLKKGHDEHLLKLQKELSAVKTMRHRLRDSLAQCVPLRGFVVEIHNSLYSLIVLHYNGTVNSSSVCLCIWHFMSTYVSCGTARPR